MTNTLLVLQFILTIILTITVLLQKSSSIGLGAYSGSNESVFGAKGPAGFLTKFTFFIGALFIMNTVTLGYLYNQQNKESVAETITVNAVLDGKNTTTIPTAPNSDKKIELNVPKVSVAPESKTKKEETKTVPTAPTTKEKKVETKTETK